MLVLTRKVREQIKIGDDIVITILRIKGQAVRVGIDAPRDQRVLRGELPDARPPAPAVTTVELNPFALPPGKTKKNPGRPLASRLNARPAPSDRLALQRAAIGGGL